MSDVNYVDLLIGEVLLGDLDNTYLYVCDNDINENDVMQQFVTRVTEEGLWVSTTCQSSGLVVVNDVQRFYFVPQSIVRCVAKGTIYNRIFLDISDDEDLRSTKSLLLPYLIESNGDFA